MAEATIWEYRSYPTSLTLGTGTPTGQDPWLAGLNSLGQSGWELVGPVDFEMTNDQGTVLYRNRTLLLKRPKQST